MIADQKSNATIKKIDEFETLDGTSITIYLQANKKSVKQYCKDTGLEYREGLWRLEHDDWNK